MPSSILNSDDGVISGTAGLKNSGGDDAVLLIQTKGVTAATVSASQVFDFVNPPTGIPSASPGGSTTQVQFNNAGAFGGISGVTTDGTRITASTTIGVGGATPSTSGSGISFPATQSASTNANTLDDYEEGTWTPSDQSGAGLTFTNAEGKYTKIGRQVTAWGWVLYPSTANGTNNQVGGLPFSIANSNPDRGGGMIGFKTDSTVVTLRGENSGTFFQFKDSTGGNITNATLSTDQFFFAITYEVA